MENATEKTQLVIFEETGGIPIQGGCSSCKDVLFTTEVDVGAAQEHRSKLEELFREHFRRVHMREDASRSSTIFWFE